METRADVQHRITLINDSFKQIMTLMEDLFDKIYQLQELPAGTWKESQEKRLGKSLDVQEQPSSIEEVIIDGNIIVRQKKAPKKKKMVVIASPSGPVIDELITIQ